MAADEISAPNCSVGSMVIMDNLAIQSSLHQLYRTLRTRVRTSLFGEHIFLDRVVLYRETDKLIKGLPIGELDALEISGNRWANAGFKSFVSTVVLTGLFLLFFSNPFPTLKSGAINSCPSRDCHKVSAKELPMKLIPLESSLVNP